MSDNEVQADCQQLLSLLGLPYLVANGEAEAQCVELERLGLCDGVVTEDSDAWLFGVKRVYKNMFSRKVNVEEYDSERVLTDIGRRFVVDSINIASRPLPNEICCCWNARWRRLLPRV